VLLGNAALHHPEAGTLLKLATWIGERTGASVGYLGDAANSVGAQLVGAMPGPGGLHAGQMLGANGSSPLKAIVLLNVEPALDPANGAAAVAACRAAEMVVMLSPFKDAGVDVADVMLPVAPFTESSGTYVSAEGRVQGVHGASSSRYMTPGRHGRSFACSATCSGSKDSRSSRRTRCVTRRSAASMRYRAA
jgi:NADH-quinone oxidoreductase subunit G